MTPDEPKPPPLTVTPPPGSRLEQLVSMYETLAARKKEAEEALKACSDAIKAEVCGAYPGTRAFFIAGSPHWPPLRLTWSQPWRVDSRRLKKEAPRLYVAFAVRSDEGQWDLRVAQ